MKPIILTTAGIEMSDRRLVQTYCYKTYSEAIAAAGGIPLIPGDSSDVEQLAELADGLFLTGGNDVDPAMYDGCLDLCEEWDLDPWRDDLEARLIRLFVEKKKPIFGICRGMQILNIVLGGNLHEDIHYCYGVKHPMHSSHMVTATPDSCLARWFGETFEVNSFHHQALDVLADGFQVIATTKENIIEAVIHRDLPILAVQWHPERMTGPEPFTPVGPDMAPMFRYFVDQCKQYTDRD